MPHSPFFLAVLNLVIMLQLYGKVRLFAWAPWTTSSPAAGARAARRHRTADVMTPRSAMPGVRRWIREGCREDGGGQPDA